MKIDIYKEYEIMRLAFTKACKCLREAIGINTIVVPNVQLDGKDVNGITWMCYFLDEAEKEIETNDKEIS